MAKDKPAKYWRFKLDTRRKFTELSQEIARINSGSGADIDLTDYATKVWVEAKGYITASTLTPYLKTEDAEETYATKDFVNNKLVNYAPLTSIQGFENRIGGLEGAVPRLNARVETVESKVATLNEYVVTGGNNLLNRVNVIEQEYATKTYVDNAIDGIDLSAYLLKADLTKSRIQSTLGISDWALASVKPTYTASEVGALAQDSSSTNADLDTILDSNTAVLKPFFQAITGTNIGSARKGVLRMSYNGSESQLLFDHYNKLLRYRTIGENPKDWATIAFTSDIPTRLSQLTDDVVAGNYLPLSGGTIRNDSNAAPLTIASSKETYTGMCFVNKNNEKGYLMYAGGSDYGVTAAGWTATYTLLHSGNIGDYNAGSATKLQTPRTLWGQSFDGTKKISGDINNAAGGICIHQTNEINSFNGKLYLNHRGSGLTGYGSTNDIVMVGNGGKVGIGTISPTERLDVSGNIKADGNINATSITINGVTITASNGSITVNGNVLATGDITGFV